MLPTVPSKDPIIYYRRAAWARFPSRRCDQVTSALFGDFVLEMSPCAGRQRRGKLKTSSLGAEDLHMGTISGFN